MRILGVVAAKCGENPHRRRGQGSLAMLVSRGLVGPKCSPNRRTRKGSRLIFLHRAEPQPTTEALRYAGAPCLVTQPFKAPGSRHGEEVTKAGAGGQALQQIGRGRGKDGGATPSQRISE